MPVYFNNAHARNHSAFFGEAFYDLALTGAQATMAPNLSPGDVCVVATPVIAAPARGRDVEFSWFVFLFDREMDDPNEPGTRVRVLFGRRVRWERLPKADAVTTPAYAAFFDVRGRFKMRSVVTP
jgi:hypothetical protein